MVRKRSGWALGCGLGCALVVILAGLAGGGAFLFMRDMVSSFKEANEVSRRVDARFGEPERFVPEAGGSIPPERVQAFLEVRRLMEPARSEMVASLDYLARGEERGWSPGRILGTFRHGFGLLERMAAFYRARSEAMLEAGMGMGEYQYIYALAYYAWLGKEPSDGPPFILQGDGDGDEEEDLPEERVLEIRAERVRGRVHDTLLAILRNQLAAAGNAPGGEVPAEWIEALKAELALMEERSLRIPWEDGLPDHLEASLQPFREELEASYSPLSNPLEASRRGRRDR